MNKMEAVNLLGIEATEITPEIVKTAYRKACSKYHPDKNPAGLEMMKMINLAYDAIKDFTGTIEHEADINYCDEVNEALNAIVGLEGLNIEICGTWVWVTGDTRPHKELFKENGFKWAMKKIAWFYKPSDSKSKSRGKYSLDDIRQSHGSKPVKLKERSKLRAAG